MDAAQASEALKNRDLLVEVRDANYYTEVQSTLTSL